MFDRITLARLNLFDSNDPSLAVFEKVLRRLIHCDGERAIVYLKNSIEQKQQQISAEQSRRASTPRDEHPLKIVLREIIQKEPNKTAKEYLTALIVYVKEKGLSMNGLCIYNELDQEFSFEEPRISTIKTSTIERKWVSSILNN
jgi:hypothetical protein